MPSRPLAPSFLGGAAPLALRPRGGSAHQPVIDFLPRVASGLVTDDAARHAPALKLAGVDLEQRGGFFWGEHIGYTGHRDIGNAGRLWGNRDLLHTALRDQQGPEIRRGPALRLR